jgi:sporulation protein YlmC with PRC-barrel domain
MEMWLKDLKGMWVVTLVEGRVLGNVNNVYLDPETLRLTGLLISTGVLLSGQSQWIPMAKVHKIGEDIFFVNYATDAGADAPQGRSLTELLGKPVVTRDGTKLGQVTDLAVELDTCGLTQVGVEAGKSVVLDTQQTVIGDMILVQYGARPGPTVHAKRREGFFSTLLSDDALEEATARFRKFFKDSRKFK